MIKLKAPEGYKLHDPKTNQDYKEAVVDEKDRDRFELVPAADEPLVVDERR